VFLLASLTSCSYQSILKEEHLQQNELRVSEVKIHTTFEHASIDHDLVTGVVKSRKDDELIGVRITVSGIPTFESDIDGSFLIKVPKNVNQTTVQFKYLGWNTIDIDFDRIKNKKIKVIMEPTLILDLP